MTPRRMLAKVAVAATLITVPLTASAIPAWAAPETGSAGSNECENAENRDACKQAQWDTSLNNPRNPRSLLNPSNPANPENQWKNSLNNPDNPMSPLNRNNPANPNSPLNPRNQH